MLNIFYKSIAMLNNVIKASLLQKGQSESIKNIVSVYYVI